MAFVIIFVSNPWEQVRRERERRASTWIDCGRTKLSLYIYVKHRSCTYIHIDIDDSHWAWSPGSDALTPLSLSPAMSNMLGSQLIRKDGSSVAVEELAGKVIGKGDVQRTDGFGNIISSHL